MITLISSSGDAFQTELYPCMHCKTLAYFIEEDPDVDCIPLPNVTSPLIDKILKFFDERLRLARELANSEMLENEDTLTEVQVCLLRHPLLQYLEHMPTDELLELLMASNYLDCEILIELIATVIASRISGKSRDEMRDILKIENDFTEQEEAQVLAENAWCFA